MTLLTYIGLAATAWMLLIVGWYSFWAWYGREHGGLHPTSLWATFTMPVWSIQSIWHSWRHSRRAQLKHYLRKLYRLRRTKPPGADPKLVDWLQTKIAEIEAALGKR